MVAHGNTRVYAFFDDTRARAAVIGLWLIDTRDFP